MRYISIALSCLIVMTAPLTSAIAADDQGGHCSLDQQYAQNPALKPSNNKGAYAALETATAKFKGQAKGDGAIIIPTVFHIMQNSPAGAESITDAQIIEALVQVNEDFNGQNARRSGKIYSQFANLEANVGMRFELAKRDPDGYTTTGITRQTSVFTSNGGQIEIKETIQWPRDRYLNIWVVLSSDGSNGSAFAFLPPSVADRPVFDGVVTSHWAVGRTGTAVTTHLGNLSHEIGHWANLSHTWGDGTNGAADQCNKDDGVSDTPNTDGNTGGTLATACGTQVQSCGSNDNVSNFMDYSCEVMFTTGQRTRMLAALNSNVSGRTNIWTTANKVATGVESSAVYALFKANKEWVAPGGTVQYTDESIRNSGGNITSWQWTFPGGTPSSHNGQTPPAVTYNTAGTYEVRLQVSNNSGNNTRIRPTQIDVNKNYMMPSSGTQSVSTDSGWFYDANYNDNYGSSETATLTINPSTSGKAIEIDFYEFNMEGKNDSGVCEWEKLEVYNGTSATGTAIGTYCGKEPQASIRSTHSSGALTFKFTSDNNTVLPGWRAKVTAVDLSATNNDILMGSTTSVTNCNAKFFDSGKYLPYKNDENSTITFNAATAGNPVSVNFTSFEMEADNCEFDFMEIFNGTSTSAAKIGTKHCGTASPGNVTATNSSGALTFRFTSDANTTLSGWEANVSCAGGSSSSGGSSSGGSSSGGSSSGGSSSGGSSSGGSSSGGLSNGQTVTGLAAAANQRTANYYIDVPTGATNLVIKITPGSGATGDADLFVKKDSIPTDSSYDCRPWIGGNTETCGTGGTALPTSVGRFHINVRGYSAFTNVNLTASYTAGGSSSGGSSSGGSSSGGSSSGGSSSGGSSSGGSSSGGSSSGGSSSGGSSGGCNGATGCLNNGQSVTGLGAAQNQRTANYYIDVPTGATNLVIKIAPGSGATGDADLFVKKGSVPTDSSYDCRPWDSGNSETCGTGGDTLATSAGRFHINLRAYSTFSNVTLTASYTGGGSSSGGSSSGGSSSGGSSSGGSSSGGSSSGGSSSGGSSSGGSIVDACATEAAHTASSVSAGDAICLKTGTASNSIAYHYIQVPANTSSMTIKTQHGTGNGSLYYNASTWATTTANTQSSTGSGNTESITVSNPGTGYRFFSVTGQQAGMTLLVELQ